MVEVVRSDSFLPISNFLIMADNLTADEWGALKDEFDALIRSEGGREDVLAQSLDFKTRCRFGALIATAARHKIKRPSAV